jgi:hypothetical protein
MEDPFDPHPKLVDRAKHQIHHPGLSKTAVENGLATAPLWSYARNGGLRKLIRPLA